MPWFKTFKAMFYDGKGDYTGRKGFSIKDKKLQYGKEKKAYLIDPTASYSEHMKIPWIWYQYRFYYNLDSSLPFRFGKEAIKGQQVLTPTDLDTLLETKVLIDLNTQPSKWGDIFTLKNVVIALIIGGILYYLFSGNSITGGKEVTDIANNTLLK